MNLSELWKLCKADKRILGISPHTLKANSGLLMTKLMVAMNKKHRLRFKSLKENSKDHPLKSGLY